MIFRHVLFLLIPFAGLIGLGRAEEPRPYVRLEASGDGTQALQTAWRRFDPPQDSGKPVVWLISVAHLGDKAYYEKTQRQLDGIELVLFEGIGFDANATVNANTGAGGGALPNPLVGNICAPPGQTWNFQFWHRNSGSPSGFSQALSATFQ